MLYFLVQVMNIKVDDEAEVQKMLEVMKSATSVMDNNPISINFTGIKRFGNGSVVYAAVTEGLEAIRALYASLQGHIPLPRHFQLKSVMLHITFMLNKSDITCIGL